MAGEHYFYFPYLAQGLAEAFLTGEEHHHLAKVLRLRQGQKIMLLDGKGLAAEAHIVRITAQKTLLKTGNIYSNYNELKRKIVLGIGLIRSSHLEWLVEKAVELGVSEIRLLHTQNVSRQKFNLPRLEKISLAAMKQCGRSRLPELFSPEPLSSFIEYTKYISSRFIFDKQNQSSSFADVLPSINTVEIALLIGPEGGFSLEELKLCQNNLFQTVMLGQRRLRTETAAIMAIALTAANSKEESL
ncbi:MAG TPA: 16S rRNA (uracil(1498)-N(3))-methyltransferase [Candidatus Marinimicrobia bacterium]|nr:16S rRNA (uracil(1498)-N(3))-methyltransferase [Candidatus Neomarinimicrobiota bacterium]